MSTTRSARRWGWLSVALVAAIAGCGSDTSAARDGSPAATSDSPVPSATGSAQLSGVPIYWIAPSRTSFALYREFRDIPDIGGPIASAVAAMTRLQPLDPDYTTPWRPASRVTASQSGDAITVDLSRDAFANTQVSGVLAARAVQQLVYTATAAAAQFGTPAGTVRITVDGAATDVWGVSGLADPIRRAPPLDVQGLAWVTSPQEGQVLPAGDIRFTGFGTSFEANFLWKVRTPAGAVLAQGHSTGGTGDGGFGESAFTAKLVAGTYVVEISQDDPSNGESKLGPAKDTKTFTVR